MLVLSRKAMESIIISVGDVRIVVRVNEIRCDRARLAFDAPPDVRIFREEIEKIPLKGVRP